jgi:hypothetical protein
MSSITLPSSVTSVDSGAFGTATIAPCGGTYTTKLYVPASIAASVYEDVQFSCSVVEYGTYGE